MNDRQEVRRLNGEYIRASLAGDAAWFDRHLAADFVCIESDGTQLERAAFLAANAKPSRLAEYVLAAVDIRIYGSVALVRAHGKWKWKDGTPGESRYVDIYFKSGGVWMAVSAQITRPPMT